jgi:hypothetical protein
LPALRETEAQPSPQVRKRIESSSKQEQIGVGD